MHTNVWSFECVESIKQHEYQMQLLFKHCVLFEVNHNMLLFSMLGLFGGALASFSFGSLLPLNKELFVFLSLFSKRLGFSNYFLVRHLWSAHSKTLFGIASSAILGDVWTLEMFFLPKWVKKRIAPQVEPLKTWSQRRRGG
jgi:hypothetical protein